MRLRFAFAKHSRWAGVDSAWEQKKLETRKMLENGDESHLSSARIVWRELAKQYALLESQFSVWFRNPES